MALTLYSIQQKEGCDDMSYFSDTQRCPYCRGDMLITEHMSSGTRRHECGSCGIEEEWRWDESGNYKHTFKRPTAYVSLLFPSGCREFKYFGKHPNKWLKGWKKSIVHMKGIIINESFGVVYNKKHNKLKTIFGPKPTIYPDSYYEDDEFFY